jgi:hypothetical protein
MIVGNKCDLTDIRQVETSEGQEFAQKNGHSFMETSASENINVENAFQLLFNNIYEKKKNENLSSINNKKNSEEKNEKSNIVIFNEKTETNNNSEGISKNLGTSKGCAC